MYRKKLSKGQWWILAGMLLFAVLCIALGMSQRRTVPKPLYETAVKAATQMQSCMEVIREEKWIRGVEIPTEDRFNTGLIGEEYNFITTTLGDLSAKRTTADPNMAAFLVFLLEEAGLKKGDILGCVFSGSFPGLNLAVLTACDAMEIHPVYLCSCGSSTWGANNPELCFPEMAVLLQERGLISTLPALITPGGEKDIGEVPDQDSFDAMWQRVKALGVPVLEEPDMTANVAFKKALLDEAGIQCFIAVGGNVTALGSSQMASFFGQGILKEEISSVNRSSGLIEYYLKEKLPTILLLNIRQLAAEYGFPFDPALQEKIGTGSIYYEQSFPKEILLAGLGLELFGLILFKKQENKKRTAAA